jgi:hypothetical protein
MAGDFDSVGDSGLFVDSRGEQGFVVLDSGCVGKRKAYESKGQGTC